MKELFIMLFDDGPFPGSYKAPSKLGWPLPEKVKAAGHKEGHYVRHYQSQGKPKDGEARGARYKWIDEPYDKEDT